MQYIIYALFATQVSLRVELRRRALLKNEACVQLENIDWKKYFENCEAGLRQKKTRIRSIIK